MDPTAIIALVEELITLGLQIRNQIAASSAIPIKTVAELTADADARFAAIQAAAIG